MAHSQEEMEAVLRRRVTGYPSNDWNIGELVAYQKRALCRKARKAIQDKGVLVYEERQRALAKERCSEAKVAGKVSLAQTQLRLRYEIHITQHPASVPEIRCGRVAQRPGKSP